MAFLGFIEEVEAYIRASNNTTIRPLLKTWTNEAIQEFVRYSNWLHLQAVWEFTTGKTFDVAAADHTTNTLSVSGDYVFKFKAGDTITVSGSTANDGDYTVSTVPSYNSATTYTEIITVEALTDSTADGEITSDHTDYGFPTGFAHWIELLDSTGTTIEQRSYKEYLQASSNYWSSIGNRLYTEGSDATYNLVYISKGATLTDDDDTSVVLDYYTDIIKQWVIYKYLIWYNDKESAVSAESLLRTDLELLKRSEARTEKSGRPIRVSAHNR